MDKIQNKEKKGERIKHFIYTVWNVLHTIVYKRMENNISCKKVGLCGEKITIDRVGHCT
jgi:hypothetical protein